MTYLGLRRPVAHPLLKWRLKPLNRCRFISQPSRHVSQALAARATGETKSFPASYLAEYWLDKEYPLNEGGHP